MRFSGGALRTIVLAAQRNAAADPLAQRFGVSHKALIPLQGKPLIAHVLDTLAHHPAVGAIAVSIEATAFDAVRAVVGRGMPQGAAIACVASADNIADSVFAAAAGHDGPLLITTADNALLAPRSIDAMAAALGHADVAIAIAPKDAVLAAHPDGQRRFYRFREAEFSNCNLYALAGPHALNAAEIFRGGGQFARKAGRIVEAFGIANLLLLRLNLLDIGSAMRRVSRRIGIDIEPVVLDDGAQAIDVDNDRTYRVVEEILAGRIGAAA